MKKDIVISYIAEALVLIAGILIYKIVAHNFGSNGFSAFALSRRNISFLLPAITLGLGVGIPRYMAIANATGRDSKCSSYAASGTFLLFFSLTTFSIILLFIKEKAAFFLFGSDRYSNFILPIIVMLFGMTAYSCIYSYYRGKLLIASASIFKAINLGVLPIASCMIAITVVQQMIIQGSLMLGCSVLIGLLIKKGFIPELKDVVPCAKELAKYGVPRVPGDLCIAGISAIPAIITAHYYGVEKAGVFAFGITIINMVGLAFAPIGLILLPKVSELFAIKDNNKIKVLIRRLVWLSSIFGVAFFLVVNLFADYLIGMMLSSSSKDMVRIIRITMIAALFLPLYVSLRSIIDATHEHAVNAVNIYKATLFMVLALSPMLCFELNEIYIPLVFSLTYLVLSGFTLKVAARISMMHKIEKTVILK